MQTSIGLRLTSAAGLVVMLALAYVASENRRKVSLRTVFTGLGLQLALALLFLLVLPRDVIFTWVQGGFDAFLAASDAGARFLFGGLVSDAQLGAVVAFRVLPIVIFVSSVAGILYHLGVVQIVIRGLARVMRKVMDLSGAESLAAALLVFLGIEATTAISEYIRRMTRSELFALMTAFMATIAGSVMGSYALFIGTENAGHLLVASLMSAPAALVVAKIMVPETEVPATRGHVHFQPLKETVNVVDAAARGAGQGLKLALNIGAMLIAFVGLVYLVNLALAGASEPFLDEPLTLERFFGWVFSPFAVAMGVPWDEATDVGRLLGIKTALNEFLAYGELQKQAPHLSDRAFLISSYALCGFANFGSVAILIGGLGAIDPDRRGLIAGLGLRALASGTLAAFMTACFAGILL